MNDHTEMGFPDITGQIHVWITAVETAHRESKQVQSKNNPSMKRRDSHKSTADLRVSDNWQMLRNRFSVH